MVFDAKEYRNRVLSQYARQKEPILRKALGELKQNPALTVPSQLNLAEFYDIPSSSTDAAIANQIDAVAGAIKAAVQKPGGSRQPLEFHELIGARNPGLRTAAFWAGVIQRGAEQARTSLAEFGANVAADFSALGVVTSKQLRDVATGSGVPESVRDAELAQVVQAAGVTVVGELPRVSAPAQVLREITTGLKKTSARSVLSAIFLAQGEPATFTVLDGFRTPDGGQSLSLATVAASSENALRRPDTDENDAFQKILGAIKNAASTDAELTDIVIAYFIDLGQQAYKEVGTKRGALRTFVERTGIDAKEAARILVQVAPMGAAQQRGFPDVQSLIAVGTLKEARRLYEALFAELAGTTSTEQVNALTALRGSEARVEELRRLAQVAQTQGDLETAGNALNEALTLCSDDESLAAVARALPPAAPVRLVSSVSADSRSVSLSWEAGFGSTDDVVYRVIRKVGSAPQNNTDGTPLGAAVPMTSFVDEKPPVAVSVFYGVSASRGGGASPVSVTSVVPVPPVTDVVMTSDRSSVNLRWTTPPEARTVDVVQSAADGSTTQLQPGAQGGTTSTGLRMGATYTYLVTAVYTGAGGETLKSATVRVTGVPRGAAIPTTGLTVRTGKAVGSRPEVVAEWDPVDGYAIEVWHYAQKPAWLPGTRLGMSEIRAQGSQLAGSATPAGTRDGVRGTTEQGLRYYVAITRDGEQGLVGAVQPFGSAPAVQNIRAERFGDEVVLSWDWPGPEYEVRVAWAGGERTIAMNEYRNGGGCRVLMGSGGGTLTVTSVAGEGDSRWVSPGTSITIEGSAAAVEYDVEFQRKIFGPPSGATLTFAVAPGSAPFDVEVIVHYSRFMPFDAAQGSVLTRASVSETSPRLEVTLPRGPKGPVWVRAFTTTPGTRLADPPPTRMKVD